jgi:cytochrome c-type biogenesis protein
MRDVGIVSAFLGGLVSFLSPCILPLIPVYLSMVSGYSAAELKSGVDRMRITARSLSFVAGFTILFSFLSLIFAGAAMLLGGPARVIEIVSGCLITLLGLNMALDFVRILDREVKPGFLLGVGKSRRGYAGAFALGIAFGAGWTPCVGPILSSILILAARGGDAGRALSLLAAYSVGLGLPFIAAGLFLDRLTPALGWFKRNGNFVRIVSGLVLAALGAVMALGKLDIISRAAS